MDALSRAAGWPTARLFEIKPRGASRLGLQTAGGLDNQRRPAEREERTSCPRLSSEA